MRFPAVVVTGTLVLAGAFYFFAKAKETTGPRVDTSQLDRTPPAPAEDFLADEADRELVRSLLDAKDLSEEQSNALVRAAGRRYMRRKLAFAAAKQSVDAGKAAATVLDPLRRDMDSARKVCDVAESLGRRTQDMTAIAQADWEMERRLAYIPSTMVGLAERFDGAAGFTESRFGRDGAGLPQTLRQTAAGQYAGR